MFGTVPTQFLGLDGFVGVGITAAALILDRDSRLITSDGAQLSHLNGGHASLF